MKLKKTLKHGQERWLVDAGVVDGKRRRLFFASKGAAEKKLSQLKADRDQIGRKWTELDPENRHEVAKVLTEIGNAGLTIRTVWDRYLAGTRAEPKSSTKKLTDAIREVIEAKKLANRRPCYVAELSRYLEPVPEVVIFQK